jgi:hypothetical protein
MLWNQADACKSSFMLGAHYANRNNYGDDGYDDISGNTIFGFSGGTGI